ncbi:hypothetical protein A3A70_01615 [candidate division WWE3 bacterium RIFCSPLOWO2_01_FULL_42_11]|uniref:Uncharacterized protein n=1 Tax=candidate division WWE3 bacterium RIFCSPLOWO2_01_FULL_42_11 TaxID=1802627 RepID=A0A1F4VR12_UNCKA|nr:MAG: hypothetical protein A3A70_01615 [candidate division WWE3 bacterium RIFCSPLOWO2_01_FULL_42_11]
MITSIDEPVSVAGVYEKSGFTPKIFLWKGRKLKIIQITLVSDIKDGTVLKRLYSVLSEGMLYRLCFNRNLEKWTVEGVTDAQNPSR